MVSMSSRAQGSCAELTSPPRSTTLSSPAPARLSIKMQQLPLLCFSLLVIGCILDGKRETVRLLFLQKGEDPVSCPSFSRRLLVGHIPGAVPQPSCVSCL